MRAITEFMTAELKDDIDENRRRLDEFAGWVAGSPDGRSRLGKVELDRAGLAVHGQLARHHPPPA
jgi:hypothetical protein